MCEHAPPQPWVLLPLTVLAAALENKRLCDQCRMRLESELLGRRQALDVDDDADEQL